MRARSILVLLLSSLLLTCDPPRTPPPIVDEGGGGGGQPYGYPGPWPLPQILYTWLTNWFYWNGYGYWEMHVLWQDSGGVNQYVSLAIFRCQLGVGTSNADAEIRSARAMFWREICSAIGQEDIWVDSNNTHELRWYTADWFRQLIPHIQTGPWQRLL
jgi:hypothetical protein